MCNFIIIDVQGKRIFSCSYMYEGVNREEGGCLFLGNSQRARKFQAVIKAQKIAQFTLTFIMSGI